MTFEEKIEYLRSLNKNLTMQFDESLGKVALIQKMPPVSKLLFELEDIEWCKTETDLLMLYIKTQEKLIKFHILIDIDEATRKAIYYRDLVVKKEELSRAEIIKNRLQGFGFVDNNEVVEIINEMGFKNQLLTDNIYLKPTITDVESESLELEKE